MNFPSLQVINFFDKPNSIKDFADTLDYVNPYGNFPGVRALPQNDYHKSVFREINTKIMRVLYPDFKVAEQLGWHPSSYFQKIKYEDVEAEILNEKNPGRGWIHCDAQSKFTAIIYLSKHDNCGTVIYSKKDKYMNTFHSVRANPNYKNSYYLKQNNINFDEYYNYLNYELDQYKTECVFNSSYNKLIGFDGANPHGAFYSLKPGEERVMFITFFEEIHAPYFPIPEMARI